MNYEVFKNELKNLKAYLESKNELETELEVLWYDLTGVKGVRFDVEHVSYNPQLAEQLKLELIDKIEHKEKELDFTCLAIERNETHLKALPSDIRLCCKQIFIQGKTFAEVGRNVGYSANGIYQRIKREVEKI